MPIVCVEMTPQELPLASSIGTFHVGDVVKLEGPKGNLVGEIRELKTKNFGVNQTPRQVLSIAVTKGDVSPFKAGGFAGYEIKVDGGAEGTVLAPCQTKFSGLLMSATELQKMVNAAISLINKAALYKSDGNARKWFGTKATDNRVALPNIHIRCAALKLGVSAFTKVILQCGAAETLGAISTTDPLRNGATCRIQLGRGFTYDRYSWGERVCTIVHEMTHWVINTVDVNVEGVDAYGAACIKLADNDTHADKALNNADNWAYYICEYRSSAESGDWSNFTESEIEARGAFVSGGYNVVQSLIAR